MRPSRFNEEQIIAILRRSQETRVERHYMEPGKPTQNPFIESFLCYGGCPACLACRNRSVVSARAG